MAEAAAKKWLKENDVRAHVQSAGTEAIPGWFAAQNAVAICTPYLDDHEAQQVTEDLLRRSDVVFCLTTGHVQHLTTIFPTHAAKVYPLALDGTSIEDPFGRNLAEYVRVQALIESHVHRRMRELFSGDV